MTDTTMRMRDVSVTYRLRASGGQRGPGAVRAILAKGEQVEALKAVSIEFHAGEVIALVGGNGAGKSTLLRTLAGLTPPSSGAVEAASRPLLLSVGAAMLPELSGERNALLGCLAQGMSMAQAQDMVPSILEFAGLGDARSRPLGTYSSGMAARLRFAVATASEHEILLVDEALSVGDAEFSERSQERMAQMASNSGTVVLVSHSMPTLREVCTRAVWLAGGTVQADGDVDTVVAEYLASTRK